MKRLAFLILLAGCASPAERDLRTLCDFATKHLEANDLSNASYVRFITTSQALPLKSLTIVEGWHAFSNAPHDPRYQLLQDAAKKAGVANWSCAPLQKLALVLGE